MRRNTEEIASEGVSDSSILFHDDMLNNVNHHSPSSSHSYFPAGLRAAAAVISSIVMMLFELSSNEANSPACYGSSILVTNHVQQFISHTKMLSKCERVMTCRQAVTLLHELLRYCETAMIYPRAGLKENNGFGEAFVLIH
jgi:hypothetical protein